MPLLCRKLLAWGDRWKTNSQKEKEPGWLVCKTGRSAGTTMETGMRREDVGAAQRGDTGGLWRTCDRVSVWNQREEGEKKCPTLTETKTGSNFIFREKENGYRGDGGANRRPRLPWRSPSSPFNPALRSFPGRFHSNLIWTWSFKSHWNPKKRRFL